MLSTPALPTITSSPGVPSILPHRRSSPGPRRREGPHRQASCADALPNMDPPRSSAHAPHGNHNSLHNVLSSVRNKEPRRGRRGAVTLPQVRAAA